jgi:hypothetical protein
MASSESSLNEMDALSMLATASMRVFEDEDWEKFIDTKSETPLVGRSDQYDIVVDGDLLMFYRDGDELPNYGQAFTLCPVNVS